MMAGRQFLSMRHVRGESARVDRTGSKLSRVNQKEFTVALCWMLGRAVLLVSRRETNRWHGQHSPSDGDRRPQPDTGHGRTR